MEQRLAVEKAPTFLLEYAGIRLFVQCATQGNPSFRLTRRNGQAVAEICHHLDGIPLAIEMAAARSRSVSVGDIQARLSDRFPLLTTGSRSALPRQRTLRAALDWSYDLLNSEERQLLDRLAVFVGGCTPRAAMAVNGSGDSGRCFDLLSSLVEKSLLVYQASAESPRYRMLETIRQYCLEHLAAHGLLEQARSLHQQYYSNFAEQSRRDGLLDKENDILAWYFTEEDNLGAALEFCMDRPGYTEQAMRVCEALFIYWPRHGLSQGRKWTSLSIPAGRESISG